MPGKHAQVGEIGGVARQLGTQQVALLAASPTQIAGEVGGAKTRVQCGERVALAVAAQHSLESERLLARARRRVARRAARERRDGGDPRFDERPADDVADAAVDLDPRTAGLGLAAQAKRSAGLEQGELLRRRRAEHERDPAPGAAHIDSGRHPLA